MFVSTKHLQDSQNPKDDINCIANMTSCESALKARQSKGERHKEQQNSGGITQVPITTRPDFEFVEKCTCIGIHNLKQQ